MNITCTSTFLVMGFLKLSFVIQVLFVNPTKCYCFINLFFLSHFYRAILVYLIPVKMLLVSVRNLCIKQVTEYLTGKLAIIISG